MDENQLEQFSDLELAKLKGFCAGLCLTSQKTEVICHYLFAQYGVDLDWETVDALADIAEDEEQL